MPAERVGSAGGRVTQKTGATSHAASLLRAAIAHTLALCATPGPGDSGAFGGIERWWVLDVPYAESVPLRRANRTDEPAPPGRVLLYEARASDTSDSLHEATTGAFHVNARCPRALVVGTAGVAPSVWAGMNDSGFRLGVLSLTPDVDSLRVALGGEAAFETDVLRWLVWANIATAPHIIDHFISMLIEGHAAGSSRKLIVPMRRARRTVCRHFARAGLASPKDWRSAFRWLRIAMKAQLDLTLTEGNIVDQNDIYDDSDLRRAFNAWFGCNVTDVRTHLGWEWLLWSAIERKQLVRTRQQWTAASQLSHDSEPCAPPRA